LASPLLSTPSASSGAPEPLFEGFADTMGLSDSLHPYTTVVPLGFTVRTWRSLVRPDAGPPGFRTQCFYACQRSPTPLGPSPPCQNGVDSVAFRVFGARRHPRNAPISGLNTLPACSPVNASPAPLPMPAHDSGPVWLAGPSLSGTCTLHHCAGLSRRLPERQVSAAAGSGSAADASGSRLHTLVGRRTGSLLCSRYSVAGPPPPYLERPCHTWHDRICTYGEDRVPQPTPYGQRTPYPQWCCWLCASHSSTTSDTCWIAARPDFGNGRGIGCAMPFRSMVRQRNS
jgi:hypothetical protein